MCCSAPSITGAKIQMFLTQRSVFTDHVTRKISPLYFTHPLYLSSHFFRSLALFTCHYQVTPDYEHSLVSFIVVLPGSAESKLWSQPTPFMKKETKVNKHNVVFQFSLIDFFTTQFARLHFIQLEVHWHSSSWRETQLVGIFDFFYILSREKVKGLQLGFIAWDWENPRFLFI